MHELFDEYFKALDETIALFGALRTDPGLKDQAYAAKDRRTAILNRLMKALKEQGIESFVEGHRRFYDELRPDADVH